jgi:hypothetical protein
MPDRIIRERSRSSPTLKQLTDAAERAWWRLTTACDDYGRFDADPEVLLAELFKRRPAGWTPRKMALVITEWESELIHLYEHSDNGHRTYGHILTFTEHQRERDSKPKFPDPPCGGLPQLAAKCGDSRLARARSESREAGAESRESRGVTSSSPQVAATWPSPEALVALYNELSPDECPAVETLSAARRMKAKQYLAQFPEESWWREVFAQMHRSRFLRGLTRKREGHEAFVADFDWLLTKGKDGSENCVKTHDGRYQRG